MKGVNVVYFLALILVVTPTWVKGLKKCDDSCILLRNCDHILQLLRNGDSKARELIRNNICGNERARVKVCCPEKYDVISEQFFPPLCGRNPVVASKILFGTDAKMGEFPWMVAIGYINVSRRKLSFKCSGSLINSRYVLTAAHCLEASNMGLYKLHNLRLGDWNLAMKNDCFESQFRKECAPPYIDAFPEEVIRHPLYMKNSASGHSYLNDIALIRMDRTIDFLSHKGYIMPICLPTYGVDVELFKRKNFVVIGWGLTEYGTASEILKKADVSLAPDSECQRYFSRNFGKTQLCVGGGESDSCQGDSGGPLMLNGPNGPPFLQIGIISFGHHCGAPGIPAVYTSVSSFMSWIKESMKPW